MIYYLPQNFLPNNNFPQNRILQFMSNVYFLNEDNSIIPTHIFDLLKITSVQFSFSLYYLKISYFDIHKIILLLSSGF